MSSKNRFALNGPIFLRITTACQETIFTFLLMLKSQIYYQLHTCGNKKMQCWLSGSTLDLVINPVFGYFFTFERYFEAREHQNRTQLEKIRPGSYSQIFWPPGRLEQPPNTPRPPPRVRSPDWSDPPTQPASRAFPQCFASLNFT